MESDSQSVVTRQLLCLAPYYLINLSVGLVQGLTMVQVVPLVEGEDVVVLLQEALERRGDVKIEVCAILNDTTGCLMR